MAHKICEFLVKGRKKKTKYFSLSQLGDKARVEHYLLVCKVAMGKQILSSHKYITNIIVRKISICQKKKSSRFNSKSSCDLKLSVSLFLEHDI